MSQTRPASEMADLLFAMADMKATWIASHRDGKGSRPEWVISLNKRDLSVLRQAVQHYRELAGGE